MTKKFKEQRKHTRYEVKFPLSISDPDTGMIVTETINISAGGAYCRVPRFIAPMTRMMLTMVVPYHKEKGKSKEEVMQCEAIVVYTKPEEEKEGTDSYEIGLWFPDLGNKSRETIQLYIKQHLDKLND